MGLNSTLTGSGWVVELDAYGSQLTADQIAAGATGVAGVDSSGGLLGPDGYGVTADSAPNIVPDGVQLVDVSTTNSTTCTITSASAAFTSADIGKICVVMPYTDTQTTARSGTITAVTSATACTATLSGAPGTLTNAIFIYGTNNATAIDAVLTAAAALPNKRSVTFPLGIICTNKSHTQPTGTHIRGMFSNSSGGKSKDFRHYGTSLVLCGFSASSAFWITGTVGGGDPRGVQLSDINIDCCNLASRAIDGSTSGRTEHLFRVTALRGSGAETYNSSATSRAMMCCFLGANQSNTVSLSGDATFVNNIVTGAGNGFYGIKCSNGDDINISNNHIWKDSSASSLLGGSIWLSFNTSNTIAGSVTVSLNKCDTNYGSGLKITVSGTSSARSISIIGNHFFNNNSVANNTGPVIELNVATGCDIRGLIIQGNHARASFASLSFGQWTYLIDNSASVGTIYGSWVGGNVGHGVNNLYNTFTPTMDGGNLIMAGTGTVVTKSVIA